MLIQALHTFQNPQFLYWAPVLLPQPPDAYPGAAVALAPIVPFPISNAPQPQNIQALFLQTYYIQL